MNIPKIYVLLVISLLLLTQTSSTKNKIKNICAHISVKLDNLNSKIKGLTNKLNELNTLGQVDYK